MSALGQKRTCAVQKGMSALPPIATSIAHFGCPLRAKSGRRDNLNSPCYSMTSSARPSNPGGSSMPSDLAVLVLMAM